MTSFMILELVLRSAAEQHSGPRRHHQLIPKKDQEKVEQAYDEEGFLVIKKYDLTGCFTAESTAMLEAGLPRDYAGHLNRICTAFFLQGRKREPWKHDRKETWPALECIDRTAVHKRLEQDHDGRFHAMLSQIWIGGLHDTADAFPV